MGSKKSGRSKSKKNWEAYAQEVADHREATGADADATQSSNQERPPSPLTPLMVTADEYFMMLRAAAKEVYGVGVSQSQKWHPEDIGTQIDAVNEVLLQGLNALCKERVRGSRQSRLL